MAKLKFKNEEEREKAYDAIPDIDDAPANVKLDEWQAEQEQKLNDIDEAEIDENYEGTGAEEDGDDGGSGDDGDASSDLEDKGGESDSEADAKVKDSGADLAQTRIDDLQKERKEMMAQFEKERADMAKKMKDLEAKVESPPEKDDKGDANLDSKLEKKDQEIKTIQEQIAELEEAMNDVDDPFDEDVQRAVVKSSTLNSRLNRLMAERYNIELSNNKKEINALKTQQKEERERLEQEQEAKRKKKAAEEGRVKTIKMIETFRKKDEFKSKKTFDDLENEYADFALNCAVADTGKTPNEITAADSEKAVQRYLSKTPILIEKMREKGIMEPEDMREFLLISDVNALKMGVKLNKQTGEWAELLNEDEKQITFPNLDSAYEYYKKEKGITGEELLNAERKAAKNVLSAIQKRANVKELNDAHQTDRIEDMDKDMATKIIDEWDETEVIEIARRDINSKKVQTYNKALMTMGLDPIEEGF